VPKKRRITDDQARLLAITIIQQAVTNLGRLGANYLGDVLPVKWQDGQTSEPSWDHVQLETHVQLQKIMDCFNEEAKRIVQENQDFRYPSNGIAQR